MFWQRVTLRHRIASAARFWPVGGWGGVPSAKKNLTCVLPGSVYLFCCVLVHSHQWKNIIRNISSVLQPHPCEMIWTPSLTGSLSGLCRPSVSQIAGGGGGVPSCPGRGTALGVSQFQRLRVILFCSPSIFQILGLIKRKARKMLEFIPCALLCVTLRAD